MLACGGRRLAPSAVPAVDRSFVAAISDRVRETTGLRVDVDPQPLPDSLEGPGALPSRTTRDSDSPYAELRALSATGVRAAPVQERERCAGIFARRDSLGSRHSGCPKSAYVLLVIGTPRRDTTEVLKAAGTGQTIPESHRWVRVLETQFSPGGRGLSVSDYVIEPSGSTRWRVVRSTALFVLD